MPESEPSHLPPAVAGIAAIAEPFYSAAVRIRNDLYDKGILKVVPLGKPAVSVGNITVGGTGKTPVCVWLAGKLAQANFRPAVLLRGYKPMKDGISDEEEVLRSALIGKAPVVADPDRVRGAVTALGEWPETSVFVLDDAMQHRRAKRNFDLVLINARNPFGFDRLLPRGLLREPLEGLKRASAILITHVSEVDAAELRRIESVIRRHNSSAPIYHSDHQICGFAGIDGLSFDPTGKKYFSFCGLASPDSFFAKLAQKLGEPTARQTFADHYPYDLGDVVDLQTMAEKTGAEFLITTEKDWAKISHHPTPVPVLRAQLGIVFAEGHEEALFNSITKSLTIAP
jgi:tetraacyldisaccharide 4'-kinase